MTTAPSNSVPQLALTVVGDKAFEQIVSQMLVAMKREKPEPRSLPLERSSTRMRTIIQATKSWMTIKQQISVPIYAGSPFVPVILTFGQFNFEGSCSGDESFVLGQKLQKG